MKTLQLRAVFGSILVMILTLINTASWAQDSTGKTTTITTESTTTTTTWYMEPWVWVVGGAVVLIILVALLRGSSSSRDREVTRTTIIKDDR
jgi:hypothetical protein